MMAHFDPHAADHVIAVGVGVLLMGVVAARLFGRCHGGNAPGGPVTACVTRIGCPESP
jgi:hypothetical protein